ncbi:HBR468Wp [Eremothecium sinecaudum]|uniref:Small ribosomal subunit protein uS4m n=1 Tax=Eremothecium sinecaudum TaxID=45286 RepID=A0A120K1G4_9SACH|nr:HBR468Wp [Eremothecium sinecaudum]AMD19369.1 HBR468Wp [Eremothecium sinecaudum]
MPRKAVLLNSLAKGRIRASFNKYNLFNLYKKPHIEFRSTTLFQQKWKSKQETRAYHGDHITESRWKSTFLPKLQSVAQLDASLQGENVEPTPILMQTYAVLEKRLDFAIFRAMFASSIRQARQFIIRGYVTVNGVKIVHPTYPLKPGDMFRVKSEKVLEALGAKKPSLKEALLIDKTQIRLWNKYVMAARHDPDNTWKAKIKELQRMDASNPEKLKFIEFMKHYNEILESEKLQTIKKSNITTTLTKVIETGEAAKESGDSKESDFQAAFYGDKSVGKAAMNVHKQLESLNVFQKFKGSPSSIASQILGSEKADNASDENKIIRRTVKQSMNEFQALFDGAIRKYYDNKKGNLQTCELPYDSEWAQKLPLHPQINVTELLQNPDKAVHAVNLPWQKGLYGRKESSKPYFTPWKPRPFLAPFAILPHHLEISFKSCSAIYLRDPVARPGHSEVISPFGLPVHQRAYMYYVRKGK